MVRSTDRNCPISGSHGRALVLQQNICLRSWVIALVGVLVALIISLPGCSDHVEQQLADQSGDLQQPAETSSEDIQSQTLLTDDAPEADDVKIEPASHEYDALVSGILSESPKLSRADSYVSSSACVQCHPNEHASWYGTFHRTMTQLAVPGNVMGDFSGQTIKSNGLEYRVFKEGEEFWAELPNPDRMLDMARGDPNVVPSEVPRVKRRVLMTTGSHHYQTYWVGHGELGTVMNTLPLVYLPEEKRWIPREAAFINPPDQPLRMITIWNDHCINCHSTGGTPGLKGPKTLETAVGELGIACEACHGPGENHVAHHRNTAINPASDSKVQLCKPDELDHVRSSQICGQCHGVFIRVGPQGLKFAREGIQFRPGEDLHKSRYYVKFPDENSTAAERQMFARNRNFYRERWWDDGTILAAGREYTAMLQTPCFQRGEMSCLSCHSMHNAPADDQLKPEAQSNQSCTGCHSEPQFNAEISSHTRHAANSDGSNCMNCHMPHTSYALFSAIRNHTISSPSVRQSVLHGVPNACNLCHLDETLDWTQQHLSDWYDLPEIALNDEEKNTAAAILWTLKGHAAQRVIAAWHFGWSSARTASGSDWMAPIISQLLADPYGVVRHVAERSLATITQNDDALKQYDFLNVESAERAKRDILAAWKRNRSIDRDAESLRQVLLDETYEPLADEVESLLRDRDDRPVSIKE